MSEFYHKHYIELNNSNQIIKAFSDAFEKPNVDSIIVNEEGKRQFRMVLLGENNEHLYKYIDGKILRTTDAEIQNEISEVENTPDRIRQRRQRAFMLIDKHTNVLAWERLSAEQKQELRQHRKDWLDAPETKVIPNKPDWI